MMSGQRFHLSFLSHPQTLSSGHHQDDGDDSPGDAEHGEERPELVGPKGFDGVPEQVAKGHDDSP